MLWKYNRAQICSAWVDKLASAIISSFGAHSLTVLVCYLKDTIKTVCKIWRNIFVDVHLSLYTKDIYDGCWTVMLAPVWTPQTRLYLLGSESDSRHSLCAKMSKVITGPPEALKRQNSQTSPAFLLNRKIRPSPQLLMSESHLNCLVSMFNKNPTWFE